MTEKINRNLTRDERIAIIQWGVSMKTLNPKFGKKDIREKLEQLGQSKGDRTLDRLLKDINDLHTNNPKGWHLDQAINWHRNDILHSDEVGLESRFLPVLRSTVGWYQFNFGIQSRYQFPKTLSYRWLKWANYFLQSINPRWPSRDKQDGIEETDIFVIAQLYTVRDLTNVVQGNIPFNDLEAWLTSRPWENDVQAKRYKDMIDADMYSPLRRLAGNNDPSVTVEKIGISFIANAYMNLCSIDQIKDLPQSEIWKLPHQQREIFVKWCKDNGKEPIITIEIPGVKEPLKIKLA